MVVSNALELYTTYLGWHEYDIIWQACIQLGLAWIPFLGLFYENLTKPFESEFGHGTETSFRRVMIEFLLMCVVIMLCIYPWVPLATSDVTYTPACSPGAKQATVGHSGTTYDNTFSSMISGEVKVPGLYKLIMDWSSGFTNALIAGTIPCSPDINGLMQQVNTAKLSPDLQKQVQAFNSQCYLQARSTFDSQQPDKSTYESILKNAGGLSDLNWMGSQVLGQLYYNNISAQQPVEGFPYSEYPTPAVNEAIQAGQMQQPQWGYPTCEQWWSTPNTGIEDRIAQQVNTQQPTSPYLNQMPITDQVNLWITKKTQNTPYNTGSTVTANDVVARSVLYDNNDNYGGFTTEQASVDTDSGLAGALAKPFIELGQTIKAGSETPFKRDALSDVLPIVQAITMFLLLLFMPLIQIFGRYRLGVCISLSFVLLSLIFLNYIWAMLGFLDEALTNSTFNPFSGGWQVQHATLHNFMSILYFAAPGFFMMLMTLAGIKIGSSIDAMLGGSAGFAKEVGKTGQDGLGMVTSAVTKLIK